MDTNNQEQKDPKENKSKETVAESKSEKGKPLAEVQAEPSETKTPEISAEAKIEELEKKLTELNDKYVRLYADFENYKKRVTKEKIDMLRFAGEDIFKQLLPVMDDFERATKAAAQTTDLETIKQGEQLIYNKLSTILIQNGLQEMHTIGQPFDPELHDAVTNIPATSEEMKGKVIEEVEKGYYLNGKVIRHAKVIVGQ